MKRVNDYFVPSVTEIQKAIQHYNRLNRAKVNFGGNGCVRERFWRLYWDCSAGHFIWYESVSERSYLRGDDLYPIVTWDSALNNRKNIVGWLTGYCD